jgi:hypothetical protein
MLVTIAAAAIAAAALATAAADPEQTPGSNITVTTCHPQIGVPPLRIGFSNTASTTAVEVDFSVIGTAGMIRTVKDVGKFEAGTPISHVFALPDGTSPLGLASARCVVTKVVYADGTTWVNPKAVP